jgi:uncharacterized protein YndB with AHSA1/START domain
MTVTAVRKDPQRLTMTLEAEFDASAERVWQLWEAMEQVLGIGMEEGLTQAVGQIDAILAEDTIAQR